MKMRNPVLILSPLSLLLFLYSCNTQTSNQDFIASYHIDKIVPVDTTERTLLRIKQTANWTISLEEKNNFELTGNEKRIVGYWNVEKMSDNKYTLLLQGGGMAIYARFDGSSMYFDRPYRMFDSLFSQVTFTRAGK